MSDPNTTPAENQAVTAAPTRPKVNPNKAAFVELAEAFPQLFNLQAAQPLAIGIHTELAAAGTLSKTKIRRGLGFYVRQRAYLKAVAAGGPRQGLQGPSGEVTAAEAEHAQQQLAELEQVLKERRAKFRSEQNKAKKPSRQPKSVTKPTATQASTPAEDPSLRLNQKLTQLSERFGKGKSE